MSPPPTPIADPLPGIRQVGDTAPTPKRQAIRWLSAELGITGAQAHRLIRAYLADQADAARGAAREEFSAWWSRRGDLLVVRGKARHDWRVHS